MSLVAEILELTRRYGAEKYAPKAFVPGETPVPVNGKVMSPRELELMVTASLDAWLTTGRFNAEFQARLAKFLGVKHLMTVNSGSSANLVAFSALTSPKLGDRAIKRGDEVITVAAGFPTTVNPAIQFGAVPVFVDVNPDTLNVDTALLEGALSDKTKAVMIAHTLGNPYDVVAVKAFCDKHNLWLVEDCCDALGSTVNGQLVGTFGDISTLSFYPAHHITMGEGGAVFTNSDELKTLAESFRDWGRDCYCEPGQDNTCGKRFGWKLGDLPEGYDHKFTYSHIGYNLKISDMQAACGVAQLDRLEEFIETRKRNFAYLAERLGAHEEYFSIAKPTTGSVPSWFGFPITLKPSKDYSREDLVVELNDAKIGTRLLFGGNLVRQPYMQDVNYRVASSLENTDNIMRNTFWIGVYPGLTEEMMDYMCDTLEGFFGLNF